MWRFVAPSFESDFRTILFDHVGAGASDLSAYDRIKYSSLAGYADDVVEIGHELGLQDAVFVGHSVSSMIGVLAAEKAPAMFGKLVLIGPSARYIDDEGYVGGFSAKQIEELLEFLESNHMGWSAQMAPMIMANPDRPELGKELTNSFCRTDPDIAKHFARVTFLSDHRNDVANAKTPALILQSTDDLIAPISVGEYLHKTLPDSVLEIIDNVGHCPHLSAPGASVAAIERFLQRPR
jgi:sigma-B regulation protein RsbQ